jgi:non-ribosomal peptide synthetase component F
VRIAGETAKFDLTLFLYEEEHGLRASLHYNTDLFDNATIRQILGHFQLLLEGIVANPEVRLLDLPILTASERDQLLVQWNATKGEYPKDGASWMFETQVKVSGCGSGFEDQQHSYQELNRRPIGWHYSATWEGAGSRWGSAWSARWRWWPSGSSQVVAPVPLGRISKSVEFLLKDSR